jgi:WD40 repeat protein
LVDQAHFDTVMELFEEILELPTRERFAQLEQRCGNDRDLREQVESLLAQTDADDGFLESGKPGDLLREHLDDLGGETIEPSAETKIPARIGRYRILGVLGRGGMGVVYEAEQDNPRRRIALKILRMLFLSERSRSRFEREAEILGRLRHPGIAHIYEAGVTSASDGEPISYYAMELVEGAPLTCYAENNGLGPRARLALIIKICDAVEHAHGHGIVHRDLKPDNILVDGRGEPRVLDFGVARIIGQQMTAHSKATATGLLIGTLPYMSPEQVGPRPDEIDARSDVYALGVIAFELLAGSLPLDVTAVSIPEAIRRICKDDAPHLGTVDRKYRGDLATIVGKALEKEPGRRYASAAGLSQDIQRYLAGKPILAKPQSGFYQFRKFAQRNNAIVAAATVAFLALLIGTGVAARQAVIARKERAIAIGFQHHAERQTYRANIAAAVTANEANDAVLARANLEAAPENVRGWEWRHVYSRLDNSSLAIDAGTGRFTELRFEADDTRLVVLDRTSMPWFVLSIALPGGAVLGQRFPVGVSRPYRVPVEATWQATRSLHFVRGESLVELTDPEGGRMRPLRRCRDDPREMAVRALTADGRRALFSYSAGTPPTESEVHLCDLETGKGGPSFRIPYGSAFAMSADGSVVAVSPKSREGSNRVEVFSTQNGARLGVFSVRVDDITTLDLSHDGGRTVAGSHNGVLRLWNVKTGRLLAERRAHGGRHIGVVRFSPDGARIASGAADRTVGLWSSDLAGEPVVLHGHAHVVSEVRFSHSGRRLASADSGGWVRLWNLDEPLDEPQVLRGHNAYVNPVRYSPDGRLIASGSWDGTVRVWDAITGEELRRFDLCPGVDMEFGVTALAIDDDGVRLAAGTTHAGVFLYDLVTGRLLRATNPDKRFSYLEFAPGGQVLFAGTTWEDLLLLDARTLEVVGREPFGLPFAWSPDGTRLLLRDSETSLVIREGQAGATLVRLEPVDDDTNTVAWSPDGRRIVTASTTGAVHVWDAGSGEQLGSLDTYKGEVHAARFHPDGTRIAVAFGDGTIRLFDSHTREELVQLRGHEAYVFDVAWSPDGGTLLSTSGDGSLRLWHTVSVRQRNARRARWREHRAEASPIVAGLLRELGRAGAVAARLSEDSALDAELRRAALTELFLQEAR